VGELQVAAAIDFGTHGSGYAWAPFNADNTNPATRKVRHSETWPGQPARSAKTLTALLLDGGGEVVEWGTPAKADVDRHAQAAGGPPRVVYGFKMRLAELAGAARQPVAHGPEQPPRSVPSLITEYLQRVYQSACDDITAGGYRTEAVRWCLTVPAGWGEAECRLMREAAEQAGMPADEALLLLAGEPEAAALYARHADGAVGHRVVVVDWGGGTVGLAAFETSPGGRLAQLGEPGSTAHGAEYLNFHFEEEVLHDRFTADAVDGLFQQHPGAFYRLVDSFERVKADFDPDRADPVTVEIPAGTLRLLTPQMQESLARRQGGDSHAIVLPREQVEAMFDRLVDPVLGLVDEQLSHARRGNPAGGVSVLLVGGFARSAYLRRRLSRHLPDGLAPVVPRDPELAVLVGAVHHAYDPSVIRERRSRLTYGCSDTPLFEQGVDRDDKRMRVGAGLGPDRCRDRFRVFVHRGEAVQPDREVSALFTPPQRRDPTLRFDLYATADPPPRYVDGCEHVGEIEVKLPPRFLLRPATARTVRVTMRFGETQVDVTAEHTASEQKSHTSIAFKPAWLRP
jgi:hypothetical protein